MRATLLIAILTLLALAPRSLAASEALGEARRQLETGNAEAAREGALAALSGPVDDAARLLLARALLALGKAEAALAPLDELARETQSPFRPAAMRLRPEALALAGRRAQAIRAYGELLERFTELPDEDEVRWRVAALQGEAARPQDEAQTLSDLLWELPLSARVEEARARLAVLAAQGVTPRARSFEERLARAQWLNRDRLFAMAGAEIETLTALAGRDESRRQALAELRFRWLVRQGRLDEAIDALGPGFRRRPEQNPDLGLLLFDALRRVGRVSQALSVLRRLERRTRMVDAERLGQALVEEGRLSEARRVFRRAYRVPKKPRHQPHQWFLAWVDYRLGDTEEALAGFAAYARKNPRSRRKAAYWQARALQDAGRHPEAQARLEKLAGEGAEDYYGCLARSRLAELGAPPPGYAERLVAAGEAAALAHVLPPAGEIPPSPPGAAPRPDLLAEIANRHADQLPRLPRAAALAHAEMWDEARRELRLLLDEADEVQARPGAARRLAGRVLSGFLDRRHRPLGPWGEDLRELRARLAPAARKAEEARLLSLRTLPRETWRDLGEAFRSLQDAWGLRRCTFRAEGYAGGVARERAYQEAVTPLAFRDIVLSEARAQGVDPSFVWGIMLVESAYNETAHSTADARGLLQILPRTASLIALDRGERAPSSTELLAPPLNIRYGVWYLARLLERFQGQPLLAAASYNAGPFRLAWRADRDVALPFDVALEQLPANRGREYAKKVLANMSRYRRLYLEDPVTYLGQRILPSVDGIDY